METIKRKASKALLALACLTTSPALAQEQLPLRTRPLTPGGAPQDLPANPELPLPVTPEQVKDGRIKAEVLSGQAVREAPLLSGTATVCKSSPLTRYRGPRLVFVRVELRNRGTNPIVIEGDQAKVVTAGGANINQISNDKVVKLDNSIIGPGGIAAVAAVSAATLGLAGPIFYEIITPQEHRKRSMGTAIGRDAGRHEIEAERFNRRVVLPADITSGWLAFYESEFKNVKELNIPLLTAPFPTSGGSLTIPIVSMDPGKIDTTNIK